VKYFAVLRYANGTVISTRYGCSC